MPSCCIVHEQSLCHLTWPLGSLCWADLDTPVTTSFLLKFWSDMKWLCHTVTLPTALHPSCSSFTLHYIHIIHTIARNATRCRGAKAAPNRGGPSPDCGCSDSLDRAPLIRCSRSIWSIRIYHQWVKIVARNNWHLIKLVTRFTKIMERSWWCKNGEEPKASAVWTWSAVSAPEIFSSRPKKRIQGSKYST